MVRYGRRSDLLMCLQCAATPRSDSSSDSCDDSASTTTQQEFTDLCVGAEVVLHSLQTASELNGQTGVVTEFVAATGRYGVKLHFQGITKAVRIENIRVLG
eukprot:TRINITY_DN114564_c0_g1_i1.p2 TRINITY_DN114564_c0_g1~~TRINITY_DN114564_c0_g1_i1.p2  ORF type:complete len:101 (-),score=4.08 TRINITY_DN114564_c0_g1_i1:430-732(-)